MKYNSGRVKKFDQTGITSDRYEFLGLEQAEPDLGDPLVGVSSIGAKPVPAGTEYDHYVPISVGAQTGSRYWIHSRALLTQGIQGLQGSLSNFQGTQGSQGRQGSQGLQGLQGLQGQISNFQGTQGTQGIQGVSNQGVQGNQGTQGRQGIQGSQGVQGFQGVQGIHGTQGRQGAQGTISNFQGTQGVQGLSNQGTQGVQATQGTQGVQGTQGTQGTQGIQGVQGTQGSQGTQGVQGQSFQGSQGIQGEYGSQGFQGTQGLGSQGAQGTQGYSGFQGSQGIQGRQGIQGVQGIQGRAGTAQGTQGVQGQSFQGSQGLQGYSGNQGAQGTQGIGFQGSQGLQGASLQGSQGLQGRDGTTQGVQGTQGISGLLGNQGSQGSQGIQGRQGTQGLSNQGVQGNQGTIGSQGFQGLQGSGIQGSQGIQGIQGSQGTDGVGTQGNQGTQGRQGIQGHQGVQGFTGGIGGQGAQGLQGRQGIQGPGGQGTQGASGTGGGNSSYSLIDLATPNGLTLGTGTFLTFPSSILNMSSLTQVPSTTTSIGVFGTNSAPTPSGTRFVQNRFKVYLTSVEFVYFYVNKAGSWGDSPEGFNLDNLILEYSYTGTSGWTAIKTVGPDDVAANTWTLISERVPAAAKYYNGVYLRIVQGAYYQETDNWAFTSVIPELGSAGSSTTSSGNGNIMIAAMNFADPNLFTIGSGVQLTTCSARGTSTRTEVPGTTNIAFFGGTSNRVITNFNRIYLTTISYLSYYVNKGAGGEEPENYQSDFLYLQYSTDGSTYVTFDTIRPIDIASVNVWTLRTVQIPDGAKYYNGVYLRIAQTSYYQDTDNWAITSLIASTGDSTNVNDPSSAGNLTVSLMNFANTLTLNLGDGVRMSSVGAYYGGMSTLTNKVPSGTLIGIFDGYLAEYQNGTRVLTNKTKVYLTTLDYILYYVNRGGTGWGDLPEYYENDNLLVQYHPTSPTASTGWVTLDTVNPIDIASSNVWTLRTITIPDAVKDFSGVYLRIVQTSFYYGTDNWAFTTLVGGFGQPESDSSSSSGNLSLFLLNFYNLNTLTVGNGTRLTSVGNYSGISNISAVPVGTPIVVFDGYLSLNLNGTRFVQNREKVHLTNVDFLNYYVNRGGTGWGDLPEYYENDNLLVQYSTDGTFWTNIDIINPIDIASSNVWTLRTIRVPSGAKTFGGVYLKITQTSFYYGTDNWAFTTLMPAFGQVGGDQNHTGSLDNVLLNLREPENLDVSNGTRLATLGSVYGTMATSTAVPTGTPIAIFDGYLSEYQNGTRYVSTFNKVYLNGISTVQFYVNAANGTWGDQPEDYQSDVLLFQYSLNGSSYTTIELITPSALNYNTWQLISASIPAAAQTVNGVYLRIAQVFYYYGTDNWAFTSIFAPFGSISVSDDTSTNATRYPMLSSVASGSPTLNVSSSKLTYNPSTGNLTSTIVSDSGGNLRKLINLAKTTSYTLAIGDVGDLVNITTGGVTVPSGVFSAGDAITIYNNSSSAQTITQGASTTMYIAGTATTGNRTLAGRGLCTVLCVVTPNEFVISGSGLS
jgi:hypothetical protein